LDTKFQLHHVDSTFKEYVGKICAKLADVAAAPSVKTYSQFFELYSEALALQFLRSKLPTCRIPELGSKTPDFECMLEDERKFFVEVKTLDIVGGELRHDQMMVDAIDQAVDIGQQVSRGKPVAVSEGEFAPYKRYAEAAYDSRSLMRVIDSLREKFVQAFKSDQFAMGPTFALAVADRLIIPGGQSALDPYYFDHDGVVSGVLWHAAFGTEGAPIFRHPDFEGAPSLEGHLSIRGMLVDEGRPFPGRALIVLKRSPDGDVALGLDPSRETGTGGWKAEDTVAALTRVCDVYNDEQNTRCRTV
jgi:hypothetical protein